MILIAGAGLGAWLITGDWLPGACLAVLVAGWLVLRAREGPPVLALAFTMQWIAVTIGVFYVSATGRPLQATLASDYQPMVVIGLGCLVALGAGLWAGSFLLRRVPEPEIDRPQHALSFKTLLLCYGGAVGLVGGITEFAWNYPSITQALIALTYIRLGILYLVLRRLIANRQWYSLTGLLMFEIAMGITGFFANFREPLILAFLAYLERFDRRSVREWAAIGTLALTMSVLGVLWVGIRVDYRARYASDEAFAENRTERLEALRSAAAAFVKRDRSQLATDVDAFVDRMWPIYYPALAIARVPDVLPHTDGKLMADALRHVFMPRIFYPDKPDLVPDSEMVRKYSGVWVAGEQEGTNIAFGYAAESYIDYGVPMMFIPVVVYGLFMGLCYEAILRLFRHRDIAVSIATVICWMSLYLFERSWAKTIGLAGTLIIYVGGVSFVVDRLWYEKWRASQELSAPDAPLAAPHPVSPR